MTSVQAIGVLIIRVYAIYLIVRAGSSMAFYAQAAIGAGEQEMEYLIRTLTYHSVLLLVGILLFALSRPLARFLTPRTAAAPGEAAPGGETLVSVGTFLIGVYLLATGLPEIAWPIWKEALHLMRRLDMNVEMTSWLDYRTGQALVRLLIGSWLVLRPGDLASLYRWLRTAGQVPPRPPEDESRPN